MQEIETPKLFFELPLKYLTQAIFYAMSGTPSKKPSCDLNFSVDSSQSHINHGFDPRSIERCLDSLSHKTEIKTWAG